MPWQKVGFTACWLLACCLAAVCTGCGLWQPSQLSRCQAEKKAVMNRVVTQERQLDELRSERKLLAERLSEAEKQVAVYSEQSPNRIADLRRNPTESKTATPTVQPRFRRESAVPNEWSPRQKRDE